MRKCFICDGDTPYSVLISNKVSHIVQCNKCGLIYDNLLNFIETTVADIYSDGADGHYKVSTIDQLEKHRRPLKLKTINNICQFIKDRGNKKLLDVGCSVGDLLKVAGENGFEHLYGLDISKTATEIARVKNTTAQIFTGELSAANYPADYFDVINISSVLVHINEPKNYLAEIYRILKPGGYLFIDDGAYNYFRLNNFVFRLLTHTNRDYKYFLNLFTANTLSKLFATTPFKIICVSQSYYSDALVKNHIPSEFRNNFITAFVLRLISISKIDRLFGAGRLLQAVLTK